MQINLARVFVDDHEKVLKFYTDLPGLLKKQDVRNGAYRWLTVVSLET
jgi:hypothetical protein